MSTTTYYRRKAQGLCPWCALPVTPQQVYCPECLEEMARRLDLALTAEERERRRLYHGTKAARMADTLTPACLGHLACCGRFQPITALPFVAPCCQRVYFAEAV